MLRKSYLKIINTKLTKIKLYLIKIPRLIKLLKTNIDQLLRNSYTLKDKSRIFLILKVLVYNINIAIINLAI